MKKIIALLMSVVLVFGVLCSCKKTEEEKEKDAEKVGSYEEVKLSEGIVAKVGDTEITVDEMKYLMADYAEYMYAQYGLADLTPEQKKEIWNEVNPENGKTRVEFTFKEELLQPYIDIVVISNKAQEKGIDVKEDLEQSKADEGFIERVNYYTENYGITEETILKFEKHMLMYQKYQSDIQPELEKDERAKVTDKQIKEKFKTDYLKAQHILIMTVDQQTQEPYSEEEKANAKKKAEGILEEVRKKGADFKKIMLEKSEDPGSQAQPEGYIFPEGQMVTEFYEGTKALKDNEISDLVETSYGYHIIKRLPLDVEKDIVEYKESIKEMLLNEKYSEIFGEIFEKAKGEMDIKVDYDKLTEVEKVLY